VVLLDNTLGRLGGYIKVIFVLDVKVGILLWITLMFIHQSLRLKEFQEQHKYFSSVYSTSSVKAKF